MPTPLRSIRLKCLDCCCYSALEVRLCPCTDCALHVYRFGKNPNRRKKAAEGHSLAKNSASTSDLEQDAPRQG